MKIIVNEKVYQDSQLLFNMERGETVLIIPTDESISEIASVFDGDDTIHAFDDNDVETGVWYVSNVISIYQNYESRTPEEPREVVVSMKASALTAEAEAALGSSIDENMEAILELGELIADMTDVKMTIERIREELDSIPKDLVQRFANIDDTYSTLADRVARLENKMEGE